MKPDKTLSALLWAACRLAEGRSLAFAAALLSSFCQVKGLLCASVSPSVNRSWWSCPPLVSTWGLLLQAGCMWAVIAVFYRCWCSICPGLHVVWPVLVSSLCLFLLHFKFRISLRGLFSFPVFSYYYFFLSSKITFLFFFFCPSMFFPLASCCSFCQSFLLFSDVFLLLSQSVLRGACLSPPSAGISFSPDSSPAGTSLLS